ncbi:MAG: proton-conducting transporter membrane subunit [Phycisphaerae bacterium]|jgi:hydrogenase-4 component F
MIWALLLIPTLAAGLAFLPSPSSRKAAASSALRRALLPAAAGCHAALTAATWVFPQGHAASILNGWLGLDAISRLFLTVTSALFLACSFYAVGYLRRERDLGTNPADATPFPHAAPGSDLGDAPEGRFIGCLLLFLATMTLVALSRHMGLLWVAVEATTLASAPLIYYHRNPRSLEATWKYLLICSVGIALALLGNFFLAVAAKGSSRAEAAKATHAPLLQARSSENSVVISTTTQAAEAADTSLHMTLDDLAAQARRLDPAWLKAAFCLLLVGYGTKMGLAPMHTWLPDAHSEAPSVVSALLSGALLNCAFLGILRAHAIVSAAGMGAFSGQLLTIFGLLSMGLAAVFVIRQSDYKRMLAYSSVEHMGVLSLGAGLGGLAGLGAMLHVVNHSLAKAMLFLLAGNILAAYRTKKIPQVRGLLGVLPASGVLWMAGFLAIVGSPPFGLFASELIILKGALQQGRVAVAVGYLAALGVIFVAMARIVLGMTYGRVAEGSPALTVRPREKLLAVLPSLALGAAVLVLGLYIPPALMRALAAAAHAVGVD